jgi:tetratricopeptide (TPR) repeat protein
MKRYDLAVEYLESTLRLRRQVLGDDHPSTISSMANLAKWRSTSGQHEEAFALAEEAIERTERVYSRRHWRYATYLSFYGGSLQGLGRYEEAADAYQESVSTHIATLGADHWRTHAVMTATAEMYEAWHDADPTAGHDVTAQQWRNRLPADGAAH